MISPRKISKQSISLNTVRHQSVTPNRDGRGNQKESMTARPGQDLNVSKMNSSFFVEVGSSVKQYARSLFSKKKNKVLDSDILKDLNLGK